MITEGEKWFIYLDPDFPCVCARVCVFSFGRCAGCPYDAQVREVRGNSLVLLWAAPLYEGSGPVTGYLVEISEGELSDCWTAVNEKPVCDTHYKVRRAGKKAAVKDHQSIPLSAPVCAAPFLTTLHCGFCVCVFVSLSSLSLSSSSSPPVPSRPSVVWFLLVSRVLLKVSSR